MAAWTHHRTGYNPLISPSLGEISVQEKIQTADISLRPSVNRIHLGEGASESLRTREHNKAVQHWRRCKRSHATSTSAKGAFLFRGSQSRTPESGFSHFSGTLLPAGVNTQWGIVQKPGLNEPYSHVWYSWQQQLIWALKLGLPLRQGVDKMCFQTERSPFLGNF